MKRVFQFCRFAAWCLIVFSLSALVWLLSGLYHERVLRRVPAASGSKSILPPVSVSPVSGGSTARTLQNEFAQVAEKSLPAVVVIQTGRTVRMWKNAGIADRLHEYYYPSREKVPTGQGSGFFLNDKGHILTNYHIVKGQDYFRVTLHDGAEFDAKLVGSDPLSDLAVLKIDAPAPTPFLLFADSEQVKAGHWAIAIGAPFSLSHTVTVGFVSCTRRTVGLNAHENFIQFDASINPGNSGGPLLDLDGRVIGVNDFILSPQGGNIGLGFAIAGNLARGIGEELISSGRVRRSWVGIRLGDVPDSVREQRKLPKGVLIAQLYRNSPADRDGLKPGDWIVRIDGQPTPESNRARMQIFSRRPGDTLTFLVLRDGQEKTIRVKADSLPDFSAEETIPSRSHP